MAEPTYVYRNVRNGKLGELTEELAAIWPDLLVKVENDDVPTDADDVTPETATEISLAKVSKPSPATDYTKD